MATPKVHIQKPDTAIAAASASPNVTTLTIKPNSSRRKELMNMLLMILLLAAVGYMAFTAGSLVSQCRRHWIDVFLNPSLSYFLAP